MEVLGAVSDGADSTQWRVCKGPGRGERAAAEPLARVPVWR
jgi:hypothetical protein